MEKCLSKLVEIAGSPLGEGTPSRPESEGSAPRVDELMDLSSHKDGFYAFESALHVFPLSRHANQMTLHDWNAPDMWKTAYGEVASRLLCFGEDIFGVQFAITDNQIVSFDGETGITEFVAGTLEEWACRVLSDYKLLTGFQFAHSWQEQHGPLREGERLVPKSPFMFGGEYDTNNLYALDAVKAMRLRGDTYTQVKDLPEGSTVRLRVVRRRED